MKFGVTNIKSVGDIMGKKIGKYNVVVSDRTLMKVYPNLDYHFLVTASLDERVKRKAIQYGSNVNLNSLKEHIIKRDKLQEKSGFYKEYSNIIKVDVTEFRSASEATNKWCKYIEELKKQGGLINDN